MFARKYQLAGLGILLLVVFIFLAGRQPHNPKLVFELADGTSVEVAGVTQGKTLRFYQGKDWQKIWFSLCGTNAPWWLRGYENTLSSSHNNGGIGVELRHWVMKDGAVLAPLNHDERLVKKDGTGKEVEGERRMVNFDVTQVLNLKQVITEEIYWEFPLSDDRELHFCLYVTNSTSRVISSNEFTIPNPGAK